MGVTTYSQEIRCSVAPGRMFKALILDEENLMPKLMPNSKNVELVHGDGRTVGSIKQTNFAQGSGLKYLKNRVDGLDVDKYECKYTTIEGDVLGNKFESISYELKFEPLGAGGCICKVTCHCHTKGENVVKEEEVKAWKEQAIEIYKVVEDYLLANPNVYA